MKNKYSEKITWIFATYNGTRMLVGAVHTLFLLNRGVPFNKIAFLQMIYMITVLIMEVPTGIVADTISGKFSVIISTIFLFVYYLFVCFFAPNIYLLSIAQIMYALALCFISGAFEEWQNNIVRTEYPNEGDKINYYGHLKYELNSLLTMFAGTIGTLIVYMGFGNYRILYITCSILMFLIFTGFLKTPYYGQKKGSLTIKSRIENYKENAGKGFKHCFRTIHGIYYFITISLLVCTYQIIFYYWQPFFVKLTKDSGIGGLRFIVDHEELLMGFIFLLYSFSRFLLNRVVRKIILDKINEFKIAIIALILSSITTILFSFVKRLHIAVYILLFALLQGMVALAESVIESQFIKVIPKGTISSTLSISNAATSLFSIGILYLLSTMLTDDTIHIFFGLTTGFYVAAVMVLIIWERKYKR